MKLFTRYNRITMMVMVLLFLLSGICYYFLINYVLIHELDEALDEYKVRIEKYIEKENQLPPISILDETHVSYSKLNEPIQYDDRPETTLLSELPENHPHHYRQRTYSQKVNNDYYRITLAKPIEGTKLLTRTVVGITIAMLLIVIVSIIILNTVLLRRLWQPFYLTLTSMKTFKLGKKKIPDFPITDIEEFSYMNTLLKDTITGAENDYRILKEFTENASHELQTPLAIIRSKLDLIIQEEGLSDKQTEALGSIYSGIKRLTKLNQSLLLLAKIENHQFTETSIVNLEEKVKEKLSQFQEFWENNEIEYKAELQPAYIQSNPELIDILLNNLIGNAGRHNKEAGTIVVKLQANELIIANTGSFKPLDHERLFRRFYKEAQHSQHNGLGLSIVKQICDQLGIDIRYEFLQSRHQFTLKWN